MSHPNTLAARTRRSLMALAVAAILLVISAFSAHAQAPAVAKIAFDRGGNLTGLNVPEPQALAERTTNLAK